MKKSVVFSVSLFFSAFWSSAFAQTEAGSMLVGGNASVGVQAYDGENQLNISLNPNLGYFIANNAAIGSSFELNFSKIDDNRFTTLGLVPFGRLYFGSDDKMRFLVQARAGFFTTQSKSDFFESDSSGLIFGAAPGVAIFFNDHVALEVLAGFTRYGGDFDFTDLGLNLGVQAYLGGE